MAVISAKMVKELRDKTGAGMMECKKALDKSNGDVQLAMEELRKSGNAKAAKCAGRVAAQGVIVILADHDSKRGMMLEVNSETDFVARDDNFLQFAQLVANTAWINKIADLSTLANHPVHNDSGLTVEEARENLISKVGENILLRRILFSPPLSHPDAKSLGYYVHGSRIGVMVTLDVVNQELAKDIAIHIAANRPLVISPDQVPEHLIAKEKEIYLSEAINSGKPQEIIEKMVAGKLANFVNEVCLVGQPFLKNPDITVGELLSKSGAIVLSFQRFEVGEIVDQS